MKDHKTDVTGPSEAEMEAAFAAIAALSKCTLPCRLQFSCVCRNEARAALTAAAQVRKAGLMPIYGATEPDQGEDVLGMKGEG